MALSGHCFERLNMSAFWSKADMPDRLADVG
jgi:hypothetical protein